MNARYKQNDNQELIQLVSFRIGNEIFGIDILKVQEIIRMMKITTVPNAPAFVVGVINLRGRVISIIDLRTKLGLPRKEANKDTRIVVIQSNNKTIGFIVDEVNEVLRIPADITEPPPELVAGINSDYISSVGKLDDRLIILLDLDRVLSVNEKMELAEST